MALLVACGANERSAQDSSGPILALPAVSGDTTCPADGQWAMCSVLKSIERAGLNVHRDSAKTVREAPLAVEGTRIPIARGEIRIFLYADSASRRRDQAKLDTSVFIRPAQEPTLRRSRTIVAGVNMLALLDVLNSRQRERIILALLAGPPQPPSRKP